MVKHYCEKCGKEVNMWLALEVYTDTDLSLGDVVPNDVVEKMKFLEQQEYELCYNCFTKFLKCKVYHEFYNEPAQVTRPATCLKRRLKYGYNRPQATRYHEINNEEDE